MAKRSTYVSNFADGMVLKCQHRVLLLAHFFDMGNVPWDLATERFGDGEVFEGEGKAL